MSAGNNDHLMQAGEQIADIHFGPEKIIAAIGFGK
jgi:hypothetical protein